MKIFWIVATMLIGLASYGESRTWTLTSGETVDGEYNIYAFEKVYIRTADGKQVKIPIEELSDEDRTFVELANPPELKVEYRESAQWKEYTADVWVDNGGQSHDNHPIKLAPAKFGVEVFQKSIPVYDHEMTIEMYIITQQNIDQDKYHIIAHSKSEPFKLTKMNGFHFEYEDPRTYMILKYNLYSELKRGEKLGEFLLLVKDEQGKVIAYNGSKKWLTTYMDRLQQLGVGAWMNSKCERVHPTSPNWGE